MNWERIPKQRAHAPTAENEAEPQRAYRSTGDPGARPIAAHRWEENAAQGINTERDPDDGKQASHGASSLSHHNTTGN